MAEAPPDVVDELYGAPLDEFVALRDARAKELRSGGQREEADAVKRLRKPSVAAWAVNQIRRRDPDGLEGLMAVGAALRQAKAATTLREAAREEREAVADLVDEAAQALRDAGRDPTAATIEEIRETLHAASADPEARELVAAGRVVQPLRAVGFGAGLLAPGRDEAAPGRAAAKPKRGRAQPAGRDRADKDTERVRARAERERAKERAADAREAVRVAKAEVRDRERELSAAERELDAAQRAADEARAALDDARERLEQREDELEEARQA